jgi:NADH:ubiquinone oxidoreductase subunit 4 (subunit M)
MVGHGLLIALLFFLVGWIEERYGTRDMRELAGLWQTDRPIAGLLTLAAFAGMGFPGLIAFWGEFLTLQGTVYNNPVWQTVIIPSPGMLLHFWGQVLHGRNFFDNSLWLGSGAPPGINGARFLQICAAAAVLGVLTSAVYMIQMLQRIVFSAKPLDEAVGPSTPVAQPVESSQPAPQLEAALAYAGVGGAEMADIAAPTGQAVAAAVPRRATSRPPQIFGLAWNQGLVLYPLAAMVIFLGLNPQPLLRLFSELGNLLSLGQWAQ